MINTIIAFNNIIHVLQNAIVTLYTNKVELKVQMKKKIQKD